MEEEEEEQVRRRIRAEKGEEEEEEDMILEKAEEDEEAAEALLDTVPVKHPCCDIAEVDSCGFAVLDPEDLDYLRCALLDVEIPGDHFYNVVPSPTLSLETQEETAAAVIKAAEQAVVMGTATGTSTEYAASGALVPSRRDRKEMHKLQKVQEKMKNERRRHKTDCARTEGYYKILPEEKWYTQRGLLRGMNEDSAGGSMAPAAEVQTQRSARSALRRQADILETFDTDLLKFNKLKVRGKQVKFGKSRIHDWGLFALERIEPNDMVIEYVGEVVRSKVADIREARYERRGMGSSYMFRIDEYEIIDATKKGNLARFINHSCDSNCYAKIIKVEGKMKIAIYSERVIEAGEEITYNYKFPKEEDKIKCLCGSSKCTGSLN